MRLFPLTRAVLKILRTPNIGMSFRGLILFNLVKYQPPLVENHFFDYTKSKVNYIVENYVENVNKYL